MGWDLEGNGANPGTNPLDRNSPPASQVATFVVTSSISISRTGQVAFMIGFNIRSLLLVFSTTVPFSVTVTFRFSFGIAAM